MRRADLGDGIQVLLDVDLVGHAVDVEVDILRELN